MWTNEEGYRVGTSHVSVGSARVVRHVTPTRIGRRCGGVDNINVGMGEDGIEGGLRGRDEGLSFFPLIFLIN